MLNIPPGFEPVENETRLLLYGLSNDKSMIFYSIADLDKNNVYISSSDEDVVLAEFK